MKIIDITGQSKPVEQALTTLESAVTQEVDAQAQTQSELDDLQKRMESLSLKLGITLPEPDVDITPLTLEINQQLLVSNTQWTEVDFHKLSPLSHTDLVVSGLAGMVSVLVDVLLVGTPEVVKIYQGGYEFDGSVLTEFLRKAGQSDGNLSPILQWFEKRCKTPYDISCVSGVVTPNNHRLRSFAHDPFFGLLFAVADILMGTTTCINNAGKITILINPKPVPLVEKLLSVLYYFGHLISDVCTFRGLTIPGFFLTQFFTDVNIGDKSIAEIAQSMYLDGYDLRHLLSMQTSVWVKDVLLHFYLRATSPNPTAITPIAQREKETLDQRLRREQLFLLANAIGTTGNLVKFLATENPCSINLPQWLAFAKSGMVTVSAITRDTAGEETMHNRDVINQRWEELKL